MQPKLDFSWGDTVVVREALLKCIGKLKVQTGKSELMSMSYPVHEGDPDLVFLLKKLAKRQSGFKFKHLFVTNGATGALHASLNALRDDTALYVQTNQAYFPFYPGIIAQHGLVQISGDPADKLRGRRPDAKIIRIADSPSNPYGELFKGKCDIWDAAYGADQYGGGIDAAPSEFKIMCGSLSKTLGLNGIRLGWAATNDDALAAALAEAVTFQYCGISQAQTNLAVCILEHVDMDEFEHLAWQKIQRNRELWGKVADKFGQPRSERGMFQVLSLTPDLNAALILSDVKWQGGQTFGQDSRTARISLGQSNALTEKAVKLILKRS